MCIILVFCVIIYACVAAPTSEDVRVRDQNISILSYENIINEDGSYDFKFETSNGISRKESGRVINVGEPNEFLQVEGFYSYTDDNGKFVLVRYTADGNGYHVQGLPAITPVAASLPSAAVATLLG